MSEIGFDYYAREYEGFLEEKHCKSLIERFDYMMETQLEEVKKYSGCKGTCTHCTCNRMDLNYHDIFKEDVNFIYHKIQDHLEVYKNDVKLDAIQWPASFSYEAMKIKKYHPDIGKHLPHVDVTDSSQTKRFMAFLIYLNDDFEGGETKFILTGKTIKPKAGKLFMFPPLWPWLHSGEQVLKTNKYFLGTYLTYKV
jgi:hypothetical protein